MDNITDYIIIIFFIVSALASLLKKKADQNKTQKQAGETNQQPAKLRVEQKPQHTTDPFEDMINILQGREKQVKVSEVDKYFEDAIKNSGNYVKPEPKRDSAYLEKANIKQQKKKDDLQKIYDNLGVQKQAFNKKALEIRSRLANRQNIKDAILLNEILSKPKAMRKTVR
jgi:hypothetical protein